MQDFRPFSPPRRHRVGFTLLEVLVVLTIIVLIAASALPAFRFITGSRSLESTQNIAGAMIGQARTAAVIGHQPHGVFFVFDPVNSRTTMALVKQEGDDTTNPDLDAYKGWTDGKDQLPTLAISYYDSSNTVDGPSFADTLTIYGKEQFRPAALPAIAKPTLRMFKCGRFHATAAAGNSPRRTSPPAPAPAPGPFWIAAAPLFLDIVANTDLQLLPPGVGVQLINDQKSFTGVASYHDRYLRTGCILVDANGQFTSINYDVSPLSRLGRSLRLPLPPGGRTLQNQNYTAGGVATFIGTGAGQSYNLFSQFGLVLYDRQALKAATATTVAPITPFAASDESDWMTRNVLTSFAAPASAADEQHEEDWLDQNSQPLILNRYNATLIKGE